MSYTRPSGDAIELRGSGIYARPAGDAIELRTPTDGVSASIAASVTVTAGLDALHGIAGTGAASVPVTAGADAAYGIAGTGAAAVAVTASIEIDYTEPGSSIAIAATVAVGAGVDAAHGIAGTGAAAVAVSAEALAAHGVAASLAAVVNVAAGLGAAHGIAGTGAATVPAVASIACQIARYEVAGEVRISGVLVDRRVRVYSRDTGALIAQGDTTAGHFRVHAGFSADEVVVMPIDLSPSATDWSPPVANRVIPVLAMDA